MSSSFHDPLTPRQNQLGARLARGSPECRQRDSQARTLGSMLGGTACYRPSKMAMYVNWAGGVTVRVRLLLRERGPARGRRRGAYPERCWPVLRTNPGRRQRAAWARAGTARSTSTGKVTLACPGLRARQDKGAAGGLPPAHSLRLVGALAKCDATRSLPLRGCGSAGWRQLKFTALRRDSEDRHRRAPESFSVVPS